MLFNINIPKGNINKNKTAFLLNPSNKKHIIKNIDDLKLNLLIFSITKIVNPKINKILKSSDSIFLPFCKKILINK